MLNHCCSSTEAASWCVASSALQERSSSSTAAVAAAAAAGDKQPKQSKQPKQQKGKDAAAVAAAAAAAEQQQQQQQQQQLALLQSQYQRSRLGELYSSHLARELLLKLNLSSVQQLPRVRSVDLSISAKDTHGRRYVSGAIAYVRSGWWCFIALWLLINIEATVLAGEFTSFSAGMLLDAFETDPAVEA
jgi:hypothetical protein